MANTLRLAHVQYALGLSAMAGVFAFLALVLMGAFH